MCEVGKKGLMRVIGVAMSIVGALHTFPTFADEVRGKENLCIWKSGINAERLAKSDAALYALKDVRVKSALKKHLPFGKPKRITGGRGKNEIVLAGPYFVIHYDKDLRSPLWTAHHLTKEQAALAPKIHPTRAEERRDSFRSDPRLDPDERAFCSDYKEKTFDQGHMVPNADIDWIDIEAGYSIGMDHSFLMSNMTPQHCEFNRGPWLVLEDLGRKWAGNAPETWIISGTVFDADGNAGRDADGDAKRMENHIGIESVAIPTHQYKILVRKDGTKWSTLSFIIPNDETMVSNAQRLGYLSDHIQTLDDIAVASGLRFLNGKTVVEGTALWPHTGKLQSVLTGRC